MSAGLKFFPGEKAECESLNRLCAICLGFSLRRLRKPFHYSNYLFFPPSPGQMANSIISGSAGTRKVQSEEGSNTQTRGEALLQAKSRSPVLELQQLSKGVAWFMISPVQSEFRNWKIMGWVYKGDVLLPAECSAPTESWPQIIIMEIESLNLIFVWTAFEIWHWLLWDK